jgi:hypothetical protein
LVVKLPFLQVSQGLNVPDDLSELSCST